MHKFKRVRVRKERRFKNHQTLENSACQELLREVWCVDWNYIPAYSGVPPDRYVMHWKNCLNEAEEHAEDPELPLSDRRVAAHLVNLVKRRLDDTPVSIRGLIDADRTFATSPTTQMAAGQAQAALHFAVKLWLHLNPELRSATASLKVAIQNCVPTRTDPTKITGYLPSDFCAKHLSRRGGFKIVQTDRLEQHLTLHKSTIEVFCNSSLLFALQQDPSTDPFAPGFVSETLQTLSLLFSPFDDRQTRWNTRYKEKHRVDLEFGLAEYEKFDLSQYPYWHEKLAAIQRQYAKTTPSGIKQWWFDSRDRVQWATFWVAFTVFVLTVVFGVISSVTGILQVYAAYNPPS